MDHLKLSSFETMGVFCLVACACLAGCRKQAEDTPEIAVTVEAQRPTSGPISNQIAADAVLAPLSQAALSPRISSPIRAEYVVRGAHVRKGQLLMTLEDRDLQGSALDSMGSLRAAEASYATATNATIPEDVQKAELDVAETRASLDVATRTSDDRKRLFSQGALPGRDADVAAAATVQAQAAYDTAVKHLASVMETTREAQTKSAEGQLTSAKGRLMSAEAQVSYASLRSPIDGVVTDRPLFPGETAVAGSPVLTIMDTSSLLAKLHIAQSSAQQLKLDGAAEITIPGIADPVSGRVSFISPALDAGSTTVEVWLKLPNASGAYKVGTSVHAVIRGINVPDALQLPVAALLPAQDGSANVMVVGPDHVAHLRAVKLGIRTPDKVQIVDGLAASDNVVIEGAYGLDDGTKVILGNGKSSAAAAEAGAAEKDKN